MPSQETTDIETALTAAVAGPRMASADGQTVESQPLSDLIAAHRYFSGIDASKRGSRGLRFTRLVPDGTVSRCGGFASRFNRLY